MDLRNWETFTGTGLPVVGANVYVYEATLTHPNGNTALASTTTDSSGMWSFTGLTDTAKDVKVEYSSRVKWYKGLTLHSVYAVRENAEDDHVEQNLLVNGGFEVYTGSAVSWTPGTGYGDVIDGWEAKRGTGDTLTVARDTVNVSTNSQYSLGLVYTKSSGDALLKAKIPTGLLYYLRGKTISASCQVKQTVGSMARLYLYDGVTSALSGRSATTGAFATLTNQNFTVAAGAAELVAALQVDVSGTIQVDNFMLNLGTEAEAFVLRFSDLDLSYTISESAPTSDTNTLAGTLNSLAARVRDIIGAAGNDWKDAIPATLTSLLSSVNTLTSTKVAKAGDSMTGALALANNVPYQVRDSGGTARDAVKATTDDVLEYGNQNYGTVRMYGFQSPSFKYRFANGSGNNTDHTVWHAGNDGAGSGLDADTLDGSQLTAVLARGNHTGTQLAATISDLALAVSGMAAASATSATSAATATSAGNADTVDSYHAGNSSGQVPVSNGTVNTNLNADMLDGQHANAFPTLAGGGNFATRPTFGSDDIPVFKVGTYTGTGSTQTISTGFKPKWVTVIGRRDSGNYIVQGHIFADAYAVNGGSVFSYCDAYTPANNLVGALSDTGFHASDGFTVDSAGMGPAFNVNTMAYAYVAYG